VGKKNEKPPQGDKKIAIPIGVVNGSVPGWGEEEEFFILPERLRIMQEEALAGKGFLCTAGWS